MCNYKFHNTDGLSCSMSHVYFQAGINLEDNNKCNTQTDLQNTLAYFGKWFYCLKSKHILDNLSLCFNSQTSFKHIIRLDIDCLLVCCDCCFVADPGYVSH